LPLHAALPICRLRRTRRAQAHRLSPPIRRRAPGGPRQCGLPAPAGALTTGTPNLMRKNTFAAAALLAAACLTLSACGASDDNSGKPVAVVSEDAAAEKAATLLDKPFEKPDLVLTDTNGKEYDFRKETAGKPTLIYFGYTHCPDVCPLTMNNIAVAKKQLSKEQQDQLRIVFVTTDPERDTA